MADRSSALLITALTRAAAESSGLPLHGTRNQPGLFPNTALGKQAAQRCQDEGLLQVRALEGNGRSTPVGTITEKGMSYLLGQVSPRQVLEDCVRILEERESQIEELLEGVRQSQSTLESLRKTINAVLSRLHAPQTDLKALFAEFRQDKASSSSAASRDLSAAIMDELRHWEQSGAQEDYPMPELYRQLERSHPERTIGQFHDSLRQLQRDQRIYLHPWTGPLYEIPQPPFALLVGHEIAYYASLRKDEG